MKPAIYLLYSCLMWLGGAVSVQASAKMVTLGTNLSSAPSGGSFSRVPAGSAEHVECILTKMDHPYRIVSMPWRRAAQEVLTQTTDGFFTTILLLHPDSKEIFSDPLVLENWYWFWRADIPEPESWRNNPRIGAIMGSPQDIWLKREGYPKTLAANELNQLLRLLFSGRIDVMLADKEQFEKMAAELDISSEAYRFRFYRYAPLGVYFGQHLIAQQPDFLARFNREIPVCAADGFQVSEYEREKIKHWLLPRIAAWAQVPTVINSVTAQNHRFKSLPIEKMIAQDQQWIEEFKRGTHTFSANLLDNPLSRVLQAIKADSNGLVTEILVTDERGFNVGISNMTTDYWQGDEEKFTHVMHRPTDTLYFGPVVYDESSRRFQVHISTQLYRPGKSLAIGVMTVGIDVERALSLEQ